MLKWLSLCVMTLSLACCAAPSDPAPAAMVSVPAHHPSNTQFDTATRTIHVLVALCDNRYQGIVPVPAGIGNGQNPATNLYWGCAYGVKTYFSKSKNWTLLRQYKIDSLLMERLVFRHRQSGWYLVADAYNGRYIQQCTVDFLQGCAGQRKDTLQVEGKALGCYGNARLLAYIGHDGLMDFSLSDDFGNADGNTRDAIMLACISKKYFAPHLKQTKARPLLWSTGLMAPEAYILHDALETYLGKGQPQQVRVSAAAAYHRYQRCGLSAADRLLVSGY
jgi:hypothetical protein